ncbi:sec-independent translocase [Streptomyces sp. NPDC046821]|uniref:sec-independent translocase n=1 Tax=Streptomyces sp. NPDC046821 TaxID=3154702 RepID=UPI00340AD4F7
MFSDVGPMELITLAMLAVLLFGPDKLPKLIQDVAAFVRKVRQFSENTKEEIRSELGPEFQDFEFEDLHPKTFVRKHVLDSDPLGIQEIRGALDLRPELAATADAARAMADGTTTSSDTTPSEEVTEGTDPRSPLRYDPDAT